MVSKANDMSDDKRAKEAFEMIDKWTDEIRSSRTVTERDYIAIAKTLIYAAAGPIAIAVGFRDADDAVRVGDALHDAVPGIVTKIVMGGSK